VAFGYKVAMRRRLRMKAGDLVSQPAVVVSLDATLEHVAAVLLEHGLSSVPVVDANRRLCGEIHEADLSEWAAYPPFARGLLERLFGRSASRDDVESIAAACRTRRAREVMRPFSTAVTEHDDLTRVAERLRQHHLSCLPVVRDGVPVGLITQHDLLRLVAPNAAVRQSAQPTTLPGRTVAA
jgi:CBS domain-containing protein